MSPPGMPHNMAVMPHEPDPPAPERVLDPVDRISEVLFGLIMVLTFTCTLSAGSCGRGRDPHAGLRRHRMQRRVRPRRWGDVHDNGAVGRAPVRAPSARQGSHPPKRRVRRSPTHFLRSWRRRSTTATSTGSTRRTAELPDPPEPELTRNDWLAAGGVALLVFGSTFPVVIPFIFIDDAVTVLRTSNVVALVMLFTCGTALGRYAGSRPYRTGLMMTALGVVLVTVTIALGG